MDENRSLIDKVVGATEEAVTRVQQEMANRQVVNATRERATAMRTKAQQAALSQLQLATRDDIVRIQASLDRIEAAVNDLAGRLPSTSMPSAGQERLVDTPQAPPGAPSPQAGVEIGEPEPGPGP